MKKFKGIVNGVSYDFEKDYKEAIDKAVKIGKGNINASSQYIEVNEPEPKTESYKLTKEDIDEIKLFNKNFKSLRSLLDDVMSMTNKIWTNKMSLILDLNKVFC